jgi:hypothetical protein
MITVFLMSMARPLLSITEQSLASLEVKALAASSSNLFTRLWKTTTRSSPSS